MLRYLIAVTDGLTLTVVLLALLSAFIRKEYVDKGRYILLSGTAAGLVGAVIVAILKNTTSKIHTGTLNVRTFTVSLIALAVLGIFNIPAVKRRLGGHKEWLSPIAAAVISFTLVFYAFPDVLAYPYTFVQNGVSLVSTDYLYRLIGWILGLVLMTVIFFAVEQAALRAGSALGGALLTAALIVNAICQTGKIIQVLQSRRILKGHVWFEIAKFSSNHSNLFIYIVLLIAAVLPAVLIFRSYHVNEPYENPAQHRKIKAKWRNARRWSFAIILCFVLAISNITWINALSSRGAELSPVEECEVRGDNVYVSLTQVEDGHLHRFAYTTPNDVAVRFIVIKKPNSSSYGVGLDACDICGETGYYERNGQIVCKLCDVVMNVNTIGFKGGCNPIVIDYSVGDGYIVVPTKGLIDNEVEFTR